MADDSVDRWFLAWSAVAYQLQHVRRGAKGRDTGT